MHLTQVSLFCYFHSPMMSRVNSKIPAKQQGARCKLYLSNMHEEGYTAVYTVCTAVNNILALRNSTKAVWDC
jgi:hypothetical protein